MNFLLVEVLPNDPIHRIGGNSEYSDSYKSAKQIGVRAICVSRARVIH
jgi:hypothetical protein